MQQGLSGLPVQICYAIKANSNLEVLRQMAKLGSGCDLVSYGEWVRAEKAKIPRPLRVLSGVAKTQEELTELLKLKSAGVGAIHVESTMELELIARLAQKYRQPVMIGLRFNPDVDAQTIDKISTGRQQDKFGLNRDEILSMARRFGRNAWVKIDGLSIHIGSQVTQIGPYQKAFTVLNQLCLDVESILGRQLGYVDLGGGFGVQYTDEVPLAFSAYADTVRRFFSRYQKILIEPGRSLVANAGFLLTTSVFTKVRSHHRTLILDAGMNDLMRPALYDAKHDFIPVVQSKSTKQKWDVVGGICETTDYFARQQPLAVTKNSGEHFAFLSCGAYGFSMSSSYNSRPRVAEVWVEGAKSRVIRRRETISDLLKHELNLERNPNSNE
jgi:diaminopimelate decarboxylase